MMMTWLLTDSLQGWVLCFAILASNRDPPRGDVSSELNQLLRVHVLDNLMKVLLV